MLTSAFLHALWSVWIKGSDDPLLFNLLQLVAPIVVLAVLLPLVPLGSLDTTAWALLAATGCAHAVYFYWMSRALEHGDLSLVYPIARSTPAFLPLVAVPLLGEQISPMGGLGIAIVVAGIWLVQGARRWQVQDFVEPAARFAFLTLGATVAYSLLDKASMTHLASVDFAGPITRPLWYGLLIHAALTLGFVPLTLTRRSMADIRAAIPRLLPRATIATIVSTFGYSLILKALESAEASYVVAVRQTSVIFAVALGIAMLGERPGFMRTGGALATVLGVALIAWFS